MTRLAALGLILLLLCACCAQAAPANPFLVRSFFGKGRLIDKIRVPPSPPPPIRRSRPAALPTAGTARTLPVPTFDWTFGCSATTAAMLFGYYDRIGFPNFYTGTVNGGVCPLTNAAWGTGNCTISATKQGLEGRGGPGHVDDYWVALDQSGNDPAPAGRHTDDCTADFMGTSQDKFGNTDGATTFYNYTNGEPLYDYLPNEPAARDGCHGMKLYANWCGYEVAVVGGNVQAFSQYILGYQGNTLGFTYENFKREIDAGRPVIVQVEGHTMLGVGYDDGDTYDRIFINNTWDYRTYQMDWGGYYEGMLHYGVTVLKLKPQVNAGADATIDEGTLFSRDGTFTNIGVAPWTCRVDYGDGAANENIPPGAGNYTLSHAYSDDGVRTLAVTLTDAEGIAGSDTVLVTVRNVAPTVNGGADAVIPPGQTLLQSGSFSDPGADTWTATVDYGDGSGVQPLPLTGKTFTLNHRYASAGNYTVTIRVTDDDGGVGTDTVLVQTSTPSALRVVSVTAASGMLVQVPIEMTARGNEHAVTCSLQFDPAVLTDPLVTKTTETNIATLQVNSSQLAAGRVGITLTLPTGQVIPAGSRNVLLVTFTIVPGATASTPVNFATQPVALTVTDTAGIPLSADWSGGSVTLNSAPVATADAYTLNEDTTLSVTAPGVLANDTDADGHTLTAAILTTPAHGTLVVQPDGSLTYTPALNYVGLDQCAYQVSDGLATVTGTITFTVAATGLEGDVAPRPHGSGGLSLTDWVQAGRYAAALDTAATGSEFMRADCAPRLTSGDGRITMADWVQAGRYAIGLDAPQPTAGPSAPLPALAATRADAATSTRRLLSMQCGPIPCGRTAVVSLLLNSQGDENALGGTLTFDAKRLEFVSAQVGSGATGARLVLNIAQLASGRLGFALMQPLPSTFAAGKQTVLLCTFRAKQIAGTGTLRIGFSDDAITREVVGATALALPINYADVLVQIRK